MAAATGTFLNVKQVRRQTEASYRPQLVFAQMNVLATSKGLGWQIPSFWTTDLESPEASKEELHDRRFLHHFAIPLYNVGLAAATNVKISWDFPIAMLVDQVNKLAQQDLIPGYFEFNSDHNLFSFHSDSWGRQFMSTADLDDITIDYLLPESAQNSKTTVTMHLPIQILLSTQIFFKYGPVLLSQHKGVVDKGERFTSLQLTPLRATILYQDISGVEHQQSFEFRFELSTARGGDDLEVLLRIKPRRLFR